MVEGELAALTMHKANVVGLTRQPLRVVVGHCPSCARVCVIENHHETWAPAQCACGWAGATTELDNHVRHEFGGTATASGPLPGRMRS